MYKDLSYSVVYFYMSETAGNSVAIVAETVATLTL